MAFHAFQTVVARKIVGLPISSPGQGRLVTLDDAVMLRRLRVSDTRTGDGLGADVFGHIELQLGLQIAIELRELQYVVIEGRTGRGKEKPVDPYERHSR